MNRAAYFLFEMSWGIAWVFSGIPMALRIVSKFESFTRVRGS